MYSTPHRPVSHAIARTDTNVSIKNARELTTAFTYDAANRRTGTTFADGTHTDTGYDELSRRTSETDQAGRTTRYTYDFEGRLVQVTDALLQVTTYGYDEVGNRLSQNDANNHQTRFEYDKLGRQTRRVLPDGNLEVKTYDPQGRVAARTDFLGRMTSFAYDQRDRLTSKTYPDSSSVVFTYTATGRRLTALDVQGTTGYAYDQRDRPTQITYPDGRKLNYTYDGQGNRTSLTATVGTTALTTGFVYDERSQVAAVMDPDGRTYTYGYDANGTPSSLAQPNGVTTTYSYDNLNRLTNLVSKHGSVTLASYAYTLGPTGLRNRVDEADGTVRVYGYDQLYRLTSETVTGSGASDYVKAFTYDPVGNRVTQVTSGVDAASVAYTYDSRDRLLTEAGVTYAWDDNGNMITKSSGDVYTWDFDDRLVKVTKPDGTIIQHQYDVDGNRVQTKVTPSAGSPSITNYLVDTTAGLSHVVAEADGTGSVGAYYVRAGSQLLAVIRGSDVRYYDSDGLGSVRELRDGSGAATDTYSTTAFGENLTRTGTDAQPYGFAGEAIDQLAGLSYNRARWMDPKSGAFLNMDPKPGKAQSPRSQHRYVYGGNDPVNMTDPSGLDFSIGVEMGLSFSVGNIVRSATRWAGLYGFSPKEYTVYMRRFAEPESFGFGFEGDHRSASTSLDVTSRVSGSFSVDPSGQGHIQKVFSDTSTFLSYSAVGEPSGSLVNANGEILFKTAGGNPVVPGSPDIDSSLSIRVQSTPLGLSLSGDLHGDSFPSAEVFVLDGRGQGKMLTTFTPSVNPSVGPYMMLFGERNVLLGSFMKLLPTDGSGNFLP